LNYAAGNSFVKTGVNFFGGNGYTIIADNTTNVPKVNITWSGAGARTLFPRIKLKDGGWIALMAQTTIADNATSIIYPDGQTTLATTGTVFANTTASQNPGNGIIWNNTALAGAINNNTIWGIGGVANCNFNASQGPAILYLEPKKWNDGSHGDYICVPMVPTSGSNPEIGIASLATLGINGTNSGSNSWQSDSYKSTAVDQYGVYVIDEQRTNENGVVTLMIPQTQMNFNIQFTSEAVSATTKETTKVVKDTEVSSVSSNNLIVIGGSCINQAAAMILTGKTDAVCGDAFAQLTGAGAGKYLIQVATSPYNSAKIAMLVAGYDAADTTNAVALVKEGSIDTSKNSATVYPVATA